MGLSGFGLSSAAGMAQVQLSLSSRDPNDPRYVALRQVLTDARHQAGLTQQQLADQLGRQQSFVAKYEVGERFLDAVELVVIGSLLNVGLNSVAQAVLGEQ